MKGILSPGDGNYLRIANKAVLSPGHVSRVLHGNKGASFHVAARIARAAGVTLDELYRYIINQPALRIRGRRTLRDAKPLTRSRKK